MDNERWSDTVGRIKDMFEVHDEYQEPLSDSPGTRDVIIFTVPTGKMKLERICRPVVIGTHGMKSKRIGSTSAVVKEYSDDVVQSIHAYQWKGGEWQEVSGEAFDTNS